MKKQIWCSLLVVVLCSCNQKSSEKKNENQDPVKTALPNNFKGKLYIMAEELDQNGDLELGCDCCASSIYFVDHSRFVEIAYCLHSDSYLKGSYEIDAEGLKLQYDRKYLDSETVFEESADSVESWKDIYSYKTGDGGKLSWKKMNSKGIYKTSFNNYSQIDHNKKEFLQRISEDSIVKSFFKL